MLRKIPKSLFVAIVFVTAWVLCTTVLKLFPSIFVPSPGDLWAAFLKMGPGLPAALVASLEITLSGFAIGVLFGVMVGLMMAYSKAFLQSLGPMMEITRPIPVYALIPLFMLWFGLGHWPQILLVALGVSSILGVQTYEAVRNMPLVYIRAASNLGASKRTIFRTIVIPYIFPHLIGAIRVAAATSWGLDVAAEFMGVQVGLGYIMIIQQMYLNTAGILVVVIIYSVMAIIMDQIIRFVESRLTRWTERSAISFEGLA